MDLRERKRVATMRRVQAVAMDLFEARGFADVRVEEIAAAAEVGPATVYRHFATKEGIVLWDELESRLLPSVRSRLPAEAPLVAVRNALLAELDRLPRSEAGAMLRRARLVARVPELKAASRSDSAELCIHLADCLVKAGSASDALDAAVIAGTIVATIEAGADEWVRGGGKLTPASAMERAFSTLERHFS